MPRLVMTIHGDRELQAALLQIPQELEQETLLKAVQAAGQIVVAAARARAPVRSGRLRRALRVKLLRRGGQSSALVGAIKKLGAHAHLVELGTAPHEIMIPGFTRDRIIQHPGTRPQPFLFPALEVKRAEVLAVIRFEVWKRIQALARSGLP